MLFDILIGFSERRLSLEGNRVSVKKGPASPRIDLTLSLFWSLPSQG